VPLPPSLPVLMRLLDAYREISRDHQQPCERDVPFAHGRPAPAGSPARSSRSDGGASAQLTTRTLTQTGGNSLAGAINWEQGPCRLRTAGPQLMNIIEHTIDKSVILK